MAEILKTEAGIFIPRELIPDFERAEVDVSSPGEITIRSKGQRRALDELLKRIDRRREDISRRRGVLDDSVVLIREGRENELR
jgi:hypothetical protein